MLSFKAFNLLKMSFESVFKYHAHFKGIYRKDIGYFSIFCFENVTETAVYFITRLMLAKGVLGSPETLQKGFVKALVAH